MQAEKFIDSAVREKDLQLQAGAVFSVQEASVFPVTQFQVHGGHRCPLMEIFADNRPGTLRKKLCQRSGQLIMILQAEQGQGCNVFAAGTALPSHALAAFPIPENKAALALSFRHLDCCTDILFRDQASIAALKRKKSYSILVKQIKSLFHCFFVEPGFQGYGMACRQSSRCLQRSSCRRWKMSHNSTGKEFLHQTKKGLTAIVATP